MKFTFTTLCLLCCMYVQAQSSMQTDSLHWIVEPGKTKVMNLTTGSRDTNSVRLHLNVVKPKKRFINKLPLFGILPFKSRTHGRYTPENEKSGRMGMLVPVPQFANKRSQAMAEIRQFDPLGRLVDTRVFPLKQKSAKDIAYPFPSQNQVEITVTNPDKNAQITVNARIETIGTGDGPNTESDAPVYYDDYDGGVFIDGTGMFANNTFMATYEANFGPSGTWIAVGPSGGDGGGGGGSGTSYEPPSAEAKKMARDLKKFAANKCEADYVIEHFMDMPEMAPLLAADKLLVESYMANHGMLNANKFGDAKENAFKHALLCAMLYCDIGLQHATAITTVHETCDNVNMNPNEKERTMDIYNNARGFEIVKLTGCNFNLIINAITTAYHNGTFHDIDGKKIY